MSTEEYTGRYLDGWVSKRFVASLRNIRRETALIIKGRRFPWPEQLTVSVYLNGELIEQSEIQEGPFTVETKIKPVMKGQLEIISSAVFVPKEVNLNEDVRSLSFLLDELIVPGMPDFMEPYQHLFSFRSERTVYFMDEALWDQLTFLLDDAYQVPDEVMLRPFQNDLWWDQFRVTRSYSIKGMVYDKFSSAPVTEGKVRLFGSGDKPVLEAAVDEHGYYEFGGVPVGEYQVVGQSKLYGEQTVKVVFDGCSKIIHIPMLPL